MRELSEELAITVSEEQILSETILNDGWLFLMQSEVTVGPLRIHGEEADRATLYNRYIPSWVPIAALDKLRIYPEIEISWLYQQLKDDN